MATQEDEFAAAFNEEVGATPTPPAQDEQPDVGGLDVEEAAQEGEQSAPAVAVVIEPMAEAGAEADGDMGGESAPAEAMEEVTEAVQAGEMSVADAIRTLKDDFGDSFPSLLYALIKATAAEIADQKVKQVSSTVDDLIADIVDSRQRAHFEAIADAHPDFMDVANGPAMQEYLASLPDDQRAQAQDTIERGNAKKIIALLSAVKVMGKGGSGDAAMDAAEGVRSGGLRIPEQPKAAQDYEAAWEQF